jgi:hypothetical protein
MPGERKNGDVTGRSSEKGGPSGILHGRVFWTKRAKPHPYLWPNGTHTLEPVDFKDADDLVARTVSSLALLGHAA